ncbi:MAG: DUF4384 domain-containing protein [Desulfobacterales bacterium]|uniref:DUF4384 domain-containing protein n=1 Tax=Candidatus Desulfaltia bathyphila TaxID=2841697 RepID=A0A8J6T7T1_9BACT|nr:DUF4384 domain-containing protein [Candidatus Desulfaltia bathyphila]MBL7195599.1 DUF4384 domain-containing protein [Desulfobacterales bacterium]MBL7208119.1 DUF4384 domain-containing protein [Desulfobacterales bacterium]
MKILFFRQYSTKVLSILVALIVFFSFPAFADELITVIAEGQAVLGEDTTPARARSLALNNARRSAIEKGTGVKIHGVSVVYNYQLISDLVSAFSKGLIVKEEVLIDDLKADGENIAYFIRIKAHIKPLKHKKPGDFRIVRAEVFRAGKASITNNPVFQNNDEIQIRVGVNTALFLNVFSVSQDGRITKLLPNKYFKHDKASADRDFIFPDDAQRQIGLKLKVHPPKNLSSAFETILIVATKEKVDLLSNSKQAENTITDLMYELSEFDQSLWTDKIIGYEIRR